MFSASFDKQDEKYQVLDEIELYNYLNSNRNLAGSDIDDFGVRTQLEKQIQNQESKDSGWRFDKVNSMPIQFHKTTELNSKLYEYSVKPFSYIKY